MPRCANGSTYIDRNYGSVVVAEQDNVLVKDLE